MAQRDEQEFESRRQQIIEGALKVFARKGFERATNREIADAAGIGSPGLIYHYFKDKADLFRQVIESRIPALQILNRADTLMEMPPREALTFFASAYLTAITQPGNLPLLRLMVGEALRRPAVADMFNLIGPTRAFGFLTTYMRHQMDLGRLREMDAGAAARCFLGPLLAFVMTREIFPQADAKTLSIETMVETTVDIFLRGMAPCAEPQREAGVNGVTVAHKA